MSALISNDWGEGGERFKFMYLFNTYNVSVIYVFEEKKKWLFVCSTLALIISELKRFSNEAEKREKKNRKKKKKKFFFYISFNLLAKKLETQLGNVFSVAYRKDKLCMRSNNNRVALEPRESVG